MVKVQIGYNRVLVVDNGPRECLSRLVNGDVYRFLELRCKFGFDGHGLLPGPYSSKGVRHTWVYYDEWSCHMATRQGSYTWLPCWVV